MQALEKVKGLAWVPESTLERVLGLIQEEVKDLVLDPGC